MYTTALCTIVHMSHADTPQTKNRKQPIIDAFWNVIAEKGVAGTTHGAVATSARVPLGSTTYYFTGLDDLIHQAFEQFMKQAAQRFEQRLNATKTSREAIEAVLVTITADLLGTQRDMAINLELYAAAARDDSYRAITSEWMGRTQAALARHFDARTTRLIDAMIEGITLHRAMSLIPPGCDETRAEARDALFRIIAGQAR